MVEEDVEGVCDGEERGEAREERAAGAVVELGGGRRRRDAMSARWSFAFFVLVGMRVWFRDFTVADRGVGWCFGRGGGALRRVGNWWGVGLESQLWWEMNGRL